MNVNIGPKETLAAAVGSAAAMCMLKLFEQVDWSWWVVASPLLVIAALCFAPPFTLGVDVWIKVEK